MPMQQSLQLRSHLTLKSAVLAMMLIAGASITLVADLAPKTAGQISYIRGGIAQGEQQVLNSEAYNYNLSLLFTQGARGEYLVDVDVQFTRYGKEIASFCVGGPRCPIKAPPASYNVIAAYQGATKWAMVQIGSTRNVQLRW